MKDLKELVTLILGKRQRSLDLFNVGDNSYSHVAERLLDGRIASDEDASAFLRLSKESSGFRMFKSRFRNKLLNSLLLISPKEIDKEYQRAIIYCNRNQFACELLRLLRAYKTAYYIAVESLDKAEKFHLWDQAIYFSRLAKTFSSDTGNIRNYKKYKELSKAYYKKLNAEETARECYSEIAINYVRATSSIANPELIRETDKNIEILKELRAKYNTYYINIYYYRLCGINAFAKREYYSALKNWNEFSEFLKTYSFLEEQFLNEVSLQQMVCYMHLKDYENGKKYGEKGKLVIGKYLYNWYVFMEYYFLLLMHSKNYNEAAEVVIEVFSDPNFNSKFQHFQEKWKIFQAYSYLLTGRKDLQVRIKKIMNDTPAYAKDKRGYNVSLLFLQIAYLIFNEEYNALTDKIDALRSYASRYLKKDSTYRSNLFLQMVLIAEAEQFNYYKTIEKCDRLLRRLNTSSMQYSGTVEDLEVIPFEDLWEMILQKIKGVHLRMGAQAAQ